MAGIENFNILLQSTVQALRRFELPNKYGTEIKAQLAKEKGNGRIVGDALKNLTGSECGLLTGELMAQSKFGPDEIFSFIKMMAVALAELKGKEQFNTQEQIEFFVSATRVFDSSFTFQEIFQYLKESITYLKLGNKAKVEFCVKVIIEMSEKNQYLREQATRFFHEKEGIAGHPFFERVPFSYRRLLKYKDLMATADQIEAMLPRELRAATAGLVAEAETILEETEFGDERFGRFNLAIKPDERLLGERRKRLGKYALFMELFESEIIKPGFKLEFTIRSKGEASGTLLTLAARQSRGDKIEKETTLVFENRFYLFELAKQLPAALGFDQEMAVVFNAELPHGVQSFLPPLIETGVKPIEKKEQILSQPSAQPGKAKPVKRKARKIIQPSVKPERATISIGAERRAVSSAFYSELGTFRRVAGELSLWQSESGRVYLLGDNFGGKAEGLILLDKLCEELDFLIPQHNLIVGADYLPTYYQSVIDPVPLKAFPPHLAENLYNLLGRLDFPRLLALRSSAPVEDRLGQSAAGIFSTEFNTSQPFFAWQLLKVFNSSYSRAAVLYYQRKGFQKIPPLPMIVQELVGTSWEYPPQAFFPALAGIINTASPSKIKVVTTVGFGLSTVSDRGLGIKHSFDTHGLELVEEKGFLPPTIYYAKDAKETEVRASLSTFSLNTESQITSRLKIKFPEFQRRLATIGLALQQRIGHPIDAEWALASPKDNRPYLLQVRTLKPKTGIIPKPSINPENILLDTSDVLGRGDKTFKHIIFANFDSGKIPKETLEELFSTFPDALFVYKTEVSLKTSLELKEFIFPFVPAAIIFDSFGDHISGSGLQHLALNVAEEDKLILCFNAGKEWPPAGILKLGDHLAEIIPGIEILELKQPLHVAADDENNWGMVYTGV